MAKATERNKPKALQLLQQNPSLTTRDVAELLGDVHHTTVWRWWVKAKKEQGAIG